MPKSVRVSNSDEISSFRRKWRASGKEKVVSIAANTWLLLANNEEGYGRLRQSMPHLPNASQSDSYTPHQSAEYGHTMAFPHLGAGPHWSY